MLIIFLPCIKLGGKLLKLGDKLPGMGGKKKPGADLPDGHGTPGGQHLPDVNDSDAMDWSTKLGMARMITELHDQVDTPVSVLIPLLNSTIAAKSQAVNGYRAEMTGPGRYDIVQFTKKKHDPAKVKEGFTTGKEGEKKKGEKEKPFDPTRVTLRTSKKGIKLESGNSQFGWEHIKKGHIIGKSGKSMFPKGLSEANIKDFIIEAIDNGTEVTSQADKIKIRYRPSPAKFGISELEVFINRAGKFVETAYPTKGSSTWTKEAILAE